MTQRKQVMSRAVRWRPSGLDGGLTWFIGVGARAMRGGSPVTAAGAVLVALAGAAASAVTVHFHGSATRVRASDAQYAASARRRIFSPYGPSACPLCTR